jgi:hypothetical protein
MLKVMVRKSVGMNTDQESSFYTYLWKTWLKLDGKIFHYLLLYWERRYETVPLQAIFLKKIKYNQKASFDITSKDTFW